MSPDISESPLGGKIASGDGRKNGYDSKVIACGDLGSLVSSSEDEAPGSAAPGNQEHRVLVPPTHAGLITVTWARAMNQKQPHSLPPPFLSILVGLSLRLPLSTAI